VFLTRTSRPEIVRRPSVPAPALSPRRVRTGSTEVRGLRVAPAAVPQACHSAWLRACYRCVFAHIQRGQQLATSYYASGDGKDASLETITLRKSVTARRPG